MTTRPTGQHDARPNLPESMRPEARPAAIKDEAWLRLQAGRAFLVREQPYIASGVYKLRPRRTREVPTAASDAKWRMYWNPDYILGLPSVSLISSLWEHELVHVTRGSSQRFEAMHEPLSYLRLWNVACDLPDNYDIARSGLPLGEGWLTFDQFAEAGIQPGMTSEQIYVLLKQYIQENPPQCNHQPGDEGEEGDGIPCPNCGQPQSGGEQDQQQSGGGLPIPDTDDPYGRTCGSSVGGPAREWEDTSDEDAVSEAEAELTRQTMARDIAAHERTHGRGSAAGGWSQWATEILNPKVDWRKVLSSKVRATLATINGRMDYSYSRPSRRQQPGIILPAMVKPEPPNVEVVVDTSGSVSNEDLNQALAEVDGVFKVLGRGKRVMVTMCDAAVHDPQPFSGNIKALEIKGRGGTDMRLGIAAAANRRPRNQIIVTITDGLTPWPDEKPRENRDAHYITVLFEPPGGYGAPPHWMTTIVIPQD